MTTPHTGIWQNTEERRRRRVSRMLRDIVRQKDLQVHSGAAESNQLRTRIIPHRKHIV